MGANVKITDFPLLQILRHQANGADTYPNPLRYAAGVTPTTVDDLTDKGYVDGKAADFILDDEQVRLIAQRRKNMTPLAWADEYDLRQVRHTIETLNSQLESMGVERLHARTILGMELKVHASLIALAVTNLN